MVFRGAARNFGLLGLATLIPASFMACENAEDIARVKPELSLNLPGAAGQAGASICQEDGLDGCQIDFGDVAVGVKATIRFDVRNLGLAKLEISSVELINASDEDTFELLGAAPKEVDGVNGKGPGFAPLNISFAPATDGEKNAELAIYSDAGNVEEGEPVIVKLIGHGIFEQKPVIAIEPAVCDFGGVPVTAMGTCDLTLTNNGNAGLVVSAFEFPGVETSQVSYELVTVLADDMIAPEASATIRIGATPQAIDVVSGELLIRNNSKNNPLARIPLIIDVLDVPFAVADVASVGGLPNIDDAGDFIVDPEVHPREAVVLTAERSTSPNGEITEYLWEVIEPQTDSVFLTTPTAKTTGFEYDSGWEYAVGLPVAGTYKIRLTVADDQGQVSQNDAVITLNAIPAESMHVSMTWDSPDHDIDLHMIKVDEGNWCSEESCYYSTCNSSYGEFSDWDATSGLSLGDATLDIDDLDGYGPENINVDQPSDGTYRVAAHAFSMYGTDTDVTIKVFLDGYLEFEETRTLEADDHFWQAVEVVWEDGYPTVTDLDVYTNNGCPGN